LAKAYFDDDANLDELKNKTVAVIGYGNQGRSQALNMRDSGVNVIVGNIEDGASWTQGKKDGFDVYSISEASKRADILFLLIPDEIMPSVYEEDIAPYIEDGNVINFASGYNVHFGFIELPETVDIVLIAPRMIGKGVRDRFVSGEGFPSLVAVHQDSTGKAKTIMLALAKAIGTTKIGAFESSFEEEAVVDLFGEQVMGGFKLYNLRMAYELLVEEYGFSPEAVLLELYLSGEGIETLRNAQEVGIWGQLRYHSTTSQYGHQTRGKYAASDASRALLRSIAENIKSGEFSKEWKTEQLTGYPVFNRLWKDNLKHPFIKSEQDLLKILNANKRKGDEK
jgi:ketol-acid reductoisomerase